MCFRPFWNKKRKQYNNAKLFFVCLRISVSFLVLRHSVQSVDFSKDPLSVGLSNFVFTFHKFKLRFMSTDIIPVCLTKVDLVDFVTDRINHRHAHHRQFPSLRECASVDRRCGSLLRSFEHQLFSCIRRKLSENWIDWGCYLNNAESKKWFRRVEFSVYLSYVRYYTNIMKHMYVLLAYIRTIGQHIWPRLFPSWFLS